MKAIRSTPLELACKPQKGGHERGARPPEGACRPGEAQQAHWGAGAKPLPDADYGEGGMVCSFGSLRYR